MTQYIAAHTCSSFRVAGISCAAPPAPPPPPPPPDFPMRAASSWQRVFPVSSSATRPASSCVEGQGMGMG